MQSHVMRDINTSLYHKYRNKQRFEQTYKQTNITWNAHKLLIQIFSLFFSKNHTMIQIFGKKIIEQVACSNIITACDSSKNFNRDILLHDVQYNASKTEYIFHYWIMLRSCKVTSVTYRTADALWTTYIYIYIFHIFWKGQYEPTTVYK